MVWLALWYMFCALNIAFVVWMFRVLTRPAFRDEIGDVTTEVGYEEDATGRPLRGWFREVAGEECEDPHVMHTGNQHIGG